MTKEPAQLFLYALEQVISLFVKGFSTAGLITAVLSTIFGYVAIKRSALFNEWHWEAVYRHARQYGKSVSEMFNVPVKSKPKANAKDAKKLH